MMEEKLESKLAEVLPKAYVAAYRWLGNADEAREACQEAATRVLAARHRFDPAQPFYPWFYRILKNHCLDRMKRQQVREPSESLDDHRLSTAVTAEGWMIAEERFEQVARAIRTLAPAHQEVIELRHFQDLTYEEMAAILECPVGTVMSRLYRARQALRSKLRSMLDEPRPAPKGTAP